MPSERLVRVFGGEPTEEEKVAVVEAVRRYLELCGDVPLSVAGSRWIRAARLEAQGLLLTERGLSRGWGT